MDTVGSGGGRPAPPSPFPAAAVESLSLLCLSDPRIRVVAAAAVVQKIKISRFFYNIIIIIPTRNS